MPKIFATGAYINDISRIMTSTQRDDREPMHLDVHTITKFTCTFRPDTQAAFECIARR